MAAGSHRQACQALDKGKVCTEKAFGGPCVGDYEKAAKSSTEEGSLSAQERWAVRREGEQAAQDTIPSRQGEGGKGHPQTGPENCHPTHLEDFSIRAMAQAVKPLETLLEKGLWPARVITRALQGLRGFASE